MSPPDIGRTAVHRCQLFEERVETFVKKKFKKKLDVTYSSLEYCIRVVKDVAKELSPIFESRLLQLKNAKKVKNLAKRAADLMLDLKNTDTFDRNTLVKKVLTNYKRKQIVTKEKDAKWFAPDVFRKPGDKSETLPFTTIDETHDAFCKKNWWDEFCRISEKLKKLTIETYHSMVRSLKIVYRLRISKNYTTNVENCSERKSTLDRCCWEIMHGLDVDNALVCENVKHSISYLKSAVSLMRDLCNLPLSHGDKYRPYSLHESETKCELAFKMANEAFSDTLSQTDKILVAKLKIMSQIVSNLTKPEAAVAGCLQSLQELHDLHIVRDAFHPESHRHGSLGFRKSVIEINEILFEFIQAHLKSPPNVEEWPATIKLPDKRIYNPLVDGRCLHDWRDIIEKDLRNYDDEIDSAVTDVAGYWFIMTECYGQILDNSIIVDQKGGCFRLPEVFAFLLFPPNAVDEKVTLKYSRVRRNKCEVKPNEGEEFVSRILKIEPEGVTFRKPVTVLLSHSLDEDQDLLNFYELIVENLSSTGCQELMTESISSIKDLPKEISKKESLDEYLPLAKATIQETCTLAAATRARFNRILIPTNRRYQFSKQYGDVAELKITFPAGVTEKILSLNVQLFPADAVVKKEIRLNKSLVCAPVIRVSGQTAPFLKEVDVELTYSHSDIANIEENFLPIGKTTKFTTEYGLLLRNHNATESRSNWQTLNESDDVFIERTGKEKLKFSFSIKHFSDVQGTVKTSRVSYVPPTNNGMSDVNNPAVHSGFVLAVYEAGSNSKTLRAILAPRIVKRCLSSKWKVELLRFMKRLKYEEPVYFCVPMSDTNESDHLLLKDNTLWFDPEDESEQPNNVADGVDLTEKFMRFLKDRECNNGENHTGQEKGDCYAKFKIQISESSPVQVGMESPEVVYTETPQGYNVPPDQEDAQKYSNKKMTRRCQLFEKTVETTAQKKLEIITAFVKNPKTGKATESVEVAGSTATVIFSLIGGITVAVGAAAFGAPAFATALVAGAVLLVKIVDKTLKQANAQEVENIIEEVDVEDKQKMSCYLNCIVKDVAKELSRIFESQIFELQSDKQVEILAESAVELMLDLKEKKKDKFDRDTLLKKVLQDGNMKKKKDLLTSDNKMKKWSAPNVFRKPGLRRIIFGKNGMKFKYSVKPKNTCDPSKYGYRGQFLEVKMYDSKKKCETSCTDKTDENQEICCKDCSSNFENCNGSRYFSESNIDNEYTEPERDKPYAYYPLHILIQCPNVFHSFKQDLEKVSFQEFLKKKSALPEKHFVRPVYRSHSPGNIPDLEKADLTETDFSYANFTKSSLQKCNFSRCVMLFAELQEAKMSGSKFCETFINHSNLKKVVADSCEWTKTSLLNSLVNGAHLENVIATIGGNCLDGTNVCDAITTKKAENREEELPQTMISGSNSSTSLVNDNKLVETMGASSIAGTYREPVQPSCLNGTNLGDANTGNLRELKHDKKTYV